MAKNLDAISIAPYIRARTATNIATIIRAFVAKILVAKSIAPYICARTATNIATTIRAFVAKNLDSKKLNRVLIGESVD
jgi:hypothetical protein